MLTPGKWRWYLEGISVYFYGQQVSEKEPQRSAGTIPIFLGCKTRLYVVVMFDIWEVRCLYVLHTDRDGGGINA